MDCSASSSEQRAYNVRPVAPGNIRPRSILYFRPKSSRTNIMLEGHTFKQNIASYIQTKIYRDEISASLSSYHLFNFSYLDILKFHFWTKLPEKTLYFNCTNSYDYIWGSIRLYIEPNTSKNCSYLLHIIKKRGNYEHSSLDPWKCVEANILYDRKE